jgi:hypothetical protein
MLLTKYRFLKPIGICKGLYSYILDESVFKPFFLHSEPLAGSISPQKELYGYATNHFGVRGRKGPSRASYICSSRVTARPPRSRWARQAWTQAFERSCKTAYFRDDEKTLGRAQESHESSIVKVEGKGIKRAAPGGSFYFFSSFFRLIS